ncbi:MAG: tryptophan synthase subunit alpha, partial [Chloroflexota bacterium]
MSQATRTQTGLDALAALFARARAEGRPAFLPYYPVGYPTYTE